MTGGFAESRERELIAEAAKWDTSAVAGATLDDMPVVDLGSYRTSRDATELQRLGSQVRWIGENVGFHFLTGHGIPVDVTEAMFAAAREFLTAPDSVKRSIEIDGPGAPIAGAGYLPIGQRRLPRRAKGNLNEAVLFKQDRALRLADNAWPDPAVFPLFRPAVEDYAAAIESVALELVPIYAKALDLPADFFDPAFASPFSRLRMTRYKPVESTDHDDFGIAPHVDTTFFTLLAQDQPGLTIFGEQQQTWLAAPVVPGALVVNTGELLRQWSNDRFVSVKHFVPPHQGTSDRYSIPFFFNATADYPMTCLPTCTSPDNPPKYPTVSYLESQAAAQGE